MGGRVVAVLAVVIAALAGLLGGLAAFSVRGVGVSDAAPGWGGASEADGVCWGAAWFGAARQSVRCRAPPG